MRLELVNTAFGPMVKFPVPAGCDMVVLCVDLWQHQPVQVLLPHQVYVRDLLVLLDRYPSARSVTVLPLRAEDKVTFDAAAIREAGARQC